jgi:glutamyl-tRNA reductase
MDTEAAGAVIGRLRAALEAVQDSELERLYGRLPKLNDESRKEIRQFSDRLVSKVLDPPLKSLDDEAANASSHALLVALQRLFKLDRTIKALPRTKALPQVTE